MRLLAAVWLAGCLGLRVDTRVELVNQTEQDLSLVVLEVAGQEVWRGPLTQGERKTVSYAIEKDGSFEIATEVTGEPVRSSPLGYTTPHDGQNHKFFLLPGGQFRYELGT